MRLAQLALASVAALSATAMPALAQKTTQTGVGGGGSPHVTSEWTIGGANISISYGRPSIKGRDESKMMPAGKVWRSGADEATVLTTNKSLTFGSLKLVPGSYTINTEPGASSWQLIVGKLGKPGQWGIPYQRDLELGRAAMKVSKTTAPVEQVTYAIDRTGNGGVLHVEWGTTRASVPFTIDK
ncbi:MAG: DUF2911 domain-containing protein [Gemmatimonadaceae bacterium]